MIGLIILAAGESSRMRYPKALLKIGEETFVERILQTATSAGVPSAVVITGPDHEAILPQVHETACIKNENYMQGQITSLQKGISAMRDPVSAVLVWPVDQPLVRLETVQKLLSAYESERKALTIPVYQGRKGHPVIYDRAAMVSAVHLHLHQTGKDLQTKYSEDTSLVEVEDAGVVIDIDTPEEYEQYIR